MDKNEQVEEVEEIIDEVNEPNEETTKSEKVELTDEERLARLEGGAKRLRKKLGLDKPEKEEVKIIKKEGFDPGELALLEVRGYSDEEDISYLEKTQKDTGKSLSELLKTEWVKKDLKEMKELRDSKDATPSDTNRSGEAINDSVEYHLAKGTTPSADQPELRKKVLDARKEKFSNSGSSKFTDRPFG